MITGCSIMYPPSPLNPPPPNLETVELLELELAASPERELYVPSLALSVVIMALLAALENLERFQY